MLGRATNALIDHDIKLFMVRIGFALGLWSITIGVTYFQTQFQRNTINRMEEHMRWGIVDEVISQPYQDVVAKKPAAYASWSQNDVQLVENQAVNSFYYIMRFSGNAFFAVLALFRLHWSLAVMATALAVVLFVLPRRLKHLVRSRMKDLSVTNETNEAFETYDSFYSFGQFRLLKQKMAQIFNEWNQAQMKLSKRNALVDAIVTLINISSQIVLLALTGYLSFQNDFAVGYILSVSELGTKVFDSLGLIATCQTRISSSQTIFEKYPAPLKNETDADVTFGFEQLALEQASFQYDEQSPWIIKDLDFNINTGDKIALVGASGSGKSISLKLLTDKLALTKGRLTINKQPTQQQQGVVRYGIISIPQTTQMISDNIQENILFGNVFDAMKYNQVLEIAGIDDDWVRRVATQDINDFSEGQKQRIALARALYSDPKLLILDEALSALDKTATHAILNKLAQIETLTIMFVTHQPQRLVPEFKCIDFEKL